MGDLIPTLVVDVGNTLITRTYPGPFERAAAVLRDRSQDSGESGRRLELARCLLTGNDRDQAACDAVSTLGFSPADLRALREALERPEGEAILLPGAETLVQTAVDRGWRVVAATNAAAWSEPLPSRLQRHVSSVMSSSHLGFLKEDEGFWSLAQTQYGLEPTRSLVVGDNPRADSQAPSAAGLCSVLTGVGRPSLTEIAGWLASAPRPPDETIGLAAGRPATWAAAKIVAVPHLSWLVASVTRCRVRMDIGQARQLRSTIVRRRDLAPALVVPQDLGWEGLAWLSATENRRNAIVPRDLAEALAAVGASMDGFPEREHRHLVSLVREARNPEIRNARIDDILTFLGGAPGKVRD
jgi:FMN phosphatase YigB (HAD superfamily)